MTLAKRIIPCLDVDHGRVVKGVSFKQLRYAGSPAALAQRYQEEGGDEIVFLDITASPERRKILKRMVRNVASGLKIPFTVGGGIRGIEDVRITLTSGADKVSINTAAVEDPILVKVLAERFGSQCVVVAIDAKRRENARRIWFEVYTYGARKPTGMDAVKWARKVEELGAGELLVTSIDKDGTRDGYDLELTGKICSSVNIPVIASGGCGEPRHMVDAFQAAGADAALAASIFHYGTYSIAEVKRYLQSRGVEVRL